MAAQDTPNKIALTVTSNIPASDILKFLRKDCPNVSFATPSDYTLEAIKKTERQVYRPKWIRSALNTHS